MVTIFCNLLLGYRLVPVPIAFTYSVYSLGRSRSEIIDDASDESLRDTHTHIHI